MEGPAPRPDWLQGLSDHYLRVAFPGPPAWHNRLIRVRFNRIEEELLAGWVLDER